MAKRTNKSDQPLPVPVDKLGTIDGYAGQTISLDRRRSPYFGAGRLEDGNFTIWLHSEQWHVEVPSNLDSVTVTEIAHALARGTIVLGRQWLPPITKEPKVRQDYIELVKNGSRLTEEDKEPFRMLLRRKSDGGYTALEIFAACRTYELRHRNRKPWLEFLQLGIDSYTGPEQLVEDYEDDDSYQVTVKDGKVIASSKQVTREIDTAPADDPAAAEALRAALDQ